MNDTEVQASQVDVNRAIIARERASAYHSLIMAGMDDPDARRLSGLEN